MRFRLSAGDGAADGEAEADGKPGCDVAKQLQHESAVAVAQARLRRCQDTSDIVQSGFHGGEHSAKPIPCESPAAIDVAKSGEHAGIFVFERLRKLHHLGLDGSGIDQAAEQLGAPRLFLTTRHHGEDRSGIFQDAHADRAGKERSQSTDGFVQQVRHDLLLAIATAASIEHGARYEADKMRESELRRVMLLQRRLSDLSRKIARQMSRPIFVLAFEGSKARVREAHRPPGLRPKLVMASRSANCWSL
ncbi:MAG: hypothetical protein E5V61_14355 [Mesorhizobium sp.]|nr:MAG: hypothetical protein E5V61_14355 [Mesorhizobium sp.]